MTVGCKTQVGFAESQCGNEVRMIASVQDLGLSRFSLPESGHWTPGSLKLQAVNHMA